jgi:hypothetical protein
MTAKKSTTEPDDAGDPEVLEPEASDPIELEHAVPPSWDLFDPDWEKLAELAARGIDPVWSLVEVCRIVNARPVRIAGSFDPADLTSESVLDRWGPGRYQITIRNGQRSYIQSRVVDIGAERPTRALDAAGVPVPGAPARSTIEERLLELALANLAGPKNDPLREAVASITTLLATSAQQSQQFMQMQLQMMQQQTTQQQNGQPNAIQMFELLTRMRAADAANVKPGDSEGFLKALQLGLSLAKGGAPTADGKPSDDELWYNFLGDIADSLGVPTVATIAQAVLGDKAAPVIDAIKAHAQARADAAAEAGPDDGAP